MTNPVLSIITVCLNERNVAATCESIVNQNWRDFEWIVIDGGSDSWTLGVFDRFRPYINIFISEKDAGIYDAMNKGVSLATGTWINFMNAGDCFLGSDTLHKVFSVPPDAETGLIYGDYRTENGRQVVMPFPLTKECLFMNNICQQAAFVRTDFHRQYPFDAKFEILADWDFFLRLCTAGVKFVKSLEPLAIFMENGISHNVPEKVFAEREKLRNKYFYEQERNEILRKQLNGLRKNMRKC